MPVFVCHYHLLYDPFDVLVCSFDNAIHLRPVGRRVMMLDHELRAELGDHSVIKLAPLSVMILSGIPC